MQGLPLRGLVVFVADGVAVVHADERGRALQVKGDQIGRAGHGGALGVNNFYGEMRDLARVGGQAGAVRGEDHRRGLARGADFLHAHLPAELVADRLRVPAS